MKSRKKQFSFEQYPFGPLPEFDSSKLRVCAPAKDRSESHSRLCAEILARIGCRPDTVAWLAPVGLFRRLDSEARVSVGVPGQADIMAVTSVVVTPEMVGTRIGLFWGIECKTGNAVLSRKQKAWRARMLSLGARHTLAKDIGQVLDESQGKSGAAGK